MGMGTPFNPNIILDACTSLKTITVSHPNPISPFIFYLVLPRIFCKENRNFHL
jgi:hypothetical protein